MALKYDINNKETLFPLVQWEDIDMLTKEELDDWLYGDGSIEDDAWVEQLTNKAH